MSEEQKIYHELETLQELGLLKGDIPQIMTQKLQEKQDNEIVVEEPTKELENHMVLPTINDED